MDGSSTSPGFVVLKRRPTGFPALKENVKPVRAVTSLINDMTILHVSGALRSREGLVTML